MFHTIARTALIAGILHLQSTISSAALTNEQADGLKEHVLHGLLASLTVICPEDWQFKVTARSVACAVAMMIIIDDMAESGYFGRHICPPPEIDYMPLFDAITEYITVKKPAPDERATDVALAGLMRKFPCGTQKDFENSAPAVG